MADDRNDSGPRDRTTINMNEGYEVRYWSKELGVSLEQLKSIVQKVGARTEDIRQELAARGNRPWQA